MGGSKGIRPVKNEWCGTGVVICLERDADLHMANCHSLSLASVKSRLVLPFWYRLTRVVPEKGPLNGCVCVCVCVCFCCVRFTLFHTKPRDWLGETSPKGPTLCRGWDVKPQLNQSSTRLFDCVYVARSSSSGRPSHARDNGNAIKP